MITQSDVKCFNYFRKKTSPNGIVLTQETHSTRKCEVPWAHQWGGKNLFFENRAKKQKVMSI